MGAGGGVSHDADDVVGRWAGGPVGQSVRAVGWRLPDREALPSVRWRFNPLQTKVIGSESGNRHRASTGRPLDLAVRWPGTSTESGNRHPTREVAV